MVSLLLTAHLLLPTPVCVCVWIPSQACFHVHTRTCVRTHTSLCSHFSSPATAVLQEVTPIPIGEP